MIGSIIDTKWPAKFEKIAQEYKQCVVIVVATHGNNAESTRTLPKLSEAIDRIGEARLLVNHGQHDCAHAHLARLLIAP